MSQKDKKHEGKTAKDAQLVVRLPRELRDDFVRACEREDTSASREIRHFIKRWLAERS